MTDEDMAFYTSTLPIVKTLTLNQKMRFRIEVMQLLQNIKHTGSTMQSSIAQTSYVAPYRHHNMPISPYTYNDQYLQSNILRPNSASSSNSIQTYYTQFSPEDQNPPSNQSTIQSRNGHKRPYHTENSNEAANAKKTRLNIVNTRGFVKTGTSLSNKINWYYMKNTDNLSNYRTFLESTKKDLIQLLKSLSTKHPIKYNLKLEATYDRPNVENSSENRAFKNSAKEMFMDTDIEINIDMDFANLLSEEDVYTSKGSGFTLQSIDGLLLGVYKYTPMAGSSYIPLPNDIKNKKAVINPQNTDQQCFKWAILARHVSGKVKNQVAENYTSYEEKYNFSDLTFPTPITEIKKFEKNNQNVSINVYGLKKQKKSEKHIIYPLKVVDEEKKDHFDLLLITDGDKSHFTYISNFSRLVRAQTMLHIVR
ncbi:hypothetical protein QTP88_000769 [Uroleucon formosanum]